MNKLQHLSIPIIPQKRVRDFVKCPVLCILGQWSDQNYAMT